MPCCAARTIAAFAPLGDEMGQYLVGKGGDPAAAQAAPEAAQEPLSVTKRALVFARKGTAP